MAKYVIELTEDEVNQLLCQTDIHPSILKDRHIELAIKTLIEVM